MLTRSFKPQPPSSGTVVMRTVLFLSLLLCLTTTVYGQKRTSRSSIRDVRLSSRRAFSGTVRTSAGKPVASRPVRVIQRGRIVASTTTKADGSYSVSGVRSGLSTLKIGSQEQQVRVWSAKAAPPSARTSVSSLWNPGRRPTVVTGSVASRVATQARPIVVQPKPASP